jgi:hypothetical protein
VKQQQSAIFAFSHSSDWQATGVGLGPSGQIHD